MVRHDPEVGERRAGAGDVHIRTFLIADVRGYTAFTQERGDEAAAELASKFAALAREGVEARGGVVVELRGDEALAVFDSARQAVRASVELQRSFVDETVAEPTLPLAVGIGLDAGEAVAVEGGYRGGALNLAARLCGIAGPGEILASPAVAHLARKVDGVAYVEREAVHLKGLADPVHVIRLRAEADDAADDMAFRRALGSSAVHLAPVVPGAIAPNPYKGLRAFEEGDAPDFFGREGLVDQLVERLAETRFLAVVGPSGSGKSSVVRAGLIPALRRGAVPGSEGWPIVDMFPGPRPLDGLEAALLRASPDPPGSLMDQLERDEHGLHRAVLRLLPSDRSELVLVIDQFEEVFTLVKDEAVRTHFLASLEAAVTDSHGRLRVVATLRADFYDRPLLYRGFAELFKSRVEAVIPLSPEELERAISGPAKRVDVSLEPGIVVAMLADVAEEPGALPLMEYALTELFERREGRVLTLDAYREIGGLSGALGRRAEELYAELDDEGKEAARQLFLRLIALGEGTEDTRRRVPRSEVASLEVDQRAMAIVLDTYGAARQLSFDRDAGTGAPTIELAHEAMLPAWPRLHRWIDAARDDLRTGRRMAAGARDWIEAGRDPSFLLAGSRLEQAETWQAVSGLAVTPEEREYLEASRAERERRTADEVARRAREEELERRSFRRLRALVAVLALAALVAGTLTAVATGQRRRAEDEARIADAQRLAAESAAVLTDDPELAILLGIEAVETTFANDGTVLAEAEEALHRAVGSSRVALSIPGHVGVAFHPDGSSLVTAQGDGSVVVWDARTGDELKMLTGHDERVNNVAFSADGRHLVTASEDGTARLWDARTWEEVATFAGSGVGLLSPAVGGGVVAATDHDGTTTVWDVESADVLYAFPGGPGIAVCPDGRLLATAGGDGPAHVWDLTTGRAIGRFSPFEVIDVAFSSDCTTLATGENGFAARIWNVETGLELEAFYGHTSRVEAVDFSPDGSRLVSASSDGTVRLWDLETGRPGLVLSGLGASVENVDFSPDGSRVVGGGSAGTAVVWDVAPTGSRELLTIEAPTGSRVSLSPDGSRLASGGEDGTTRVFDAATGEETAALEGPAPVTHAVFGPDGSTILTGGADGTARLWDLETGEELERFATGAFLFSVAFSPDGTRVATVGDGEPTVGDGEPTVWDVRTGEPITTLEGHEPGRMVFEVAFSPQGTLVATTSQDETLRIWDAESGEQLRVLTGHRNNVFGVAFSPDGRLIASGSPDGTARIWDVQTGDQLLVLRGHVGTVIGVAFSPDGSRLATTGDDRTVRIWDVGTGRQLLTLYGHTSNVTSAAFYPAGDRLVSGSDDGTIRVFVLAIDDLLRLAHERVTRTLTQQECRQYEIDHCPATD